MFHFSSKATSVASVYEGSWEEIAGAFSLSLEFIAETYPKATADASAGNAKVSRQSSGGRVIWWLPPCFLLGQVVARWPVTLKNAVALLSGCN